MAADLVHADSRRDLVYAIVECHAPGEHFAYHGNHVIRLERQPMLGVAHAASGGVGHLAILQMIPRAREQVVIARMVVMQVGDDDVVNLVRRNVDRLQALGYRLGDLALALLPHCVIEASIDNRCALLSHNSPDKKIERLRSIVGITSDEVLRGATVMVPILDGINFVLAHQPALCCLRAAPFPRARTSTPARFSNGWITVVKSFSPPISSCARAKSRPTLRMISIERPRDSASCKQSRRSLIISAVAKP